MSEVSGTTKKPYKQKGTGRARQRLARAPAIPRRRRRVRPGGAQTMRTTCRRRCGVLALKTALSSKQADGKLVVLDAAKLSDGKTKALAANSRSSAGAAR